MLSSKVTIEGVENITIIGHRNPAVKCNDFGAIKFISCKNVSIEGIQWKECGSIDNPGIEFYNSSDVSFEKCSFYSSKGTSVLMSEMCGNVYIIKCNFTHSNSTGNGSAVYYIPNVCSHNQHFLFIQKSNFLFNKVNQSVVYIDGSGSRITVQVYLQDSTFFNNMGVPLYISYCNLYIKGSVLFQGNTAVYGGAIYSNNSAVMYFDKSNVNFLTNTVSADGGAIYLVNSRIAFEVHAKVTFNGNSAQEHGGAVYSANSNITFNGSSSVMFFNNEAGRKKRGGGVYCRSSSHIKFDGSSSIMFNNNKAWMGGALYCIYSSNITFNGNSSVTFYSNVAYLYGGAVACWSSSLITFNDNSNVTFNNNEGDDGGAVNCWSSSNVTFEGNSRVTFKNNIARYRGGGLFSEASSHITFNGSSNITFNYNKAGFGGASYCGTLSVITFDSNTVVTLNDNEADFEGGAVNSKFSSLIAFNGNSDVTFNSNEASNGGAHYIANNSTAIISGYSKVIYSNNKGSQYGGAIYCASNSTISHNGTASVTFANNTCEYGGAISIIHSIIILDGDTSVNFTNNMAENGGAVLGENVVATLKGSIHINFLDNSAIGSCGAIHLSNHYDLNIFHNSNITFHRNRANHYGGAIYCDMSKTSESKLTFNTTNTVFVKNIDVVKSDIYLDIPVTCDETCLNNSNIISGNKSGITIKTSPKKLKLNDTVATCIGNGNNTFCERYLTRNVMIGQKLSIGACVLDHYNQPAEPTQFVLRSEDQYHQIMGPENVLVSCVPFEGVIIMGEEVLKPKNFSLTFTSFEGIISNSKKFSIELVTELSPCHPGFHYGNATQTCVCYSDSDIVSCSDSRSSIKRGYWFGEVDGKATVTVCPNSYCNFSCCEAANGFFELSSARANQCNSQRFGTACGSCKKGFTLSFDSIECVSVDKCTIEQTVLVVTLSILYWVVIVIVVFIVTYYHIGIGYFYVITYFYSMVDILLGEHLYISQGLFTCVSVISSTAKVTPQFLGQLCLVTNMSGIDQQFIHYVHPLAVAIIIIIICLSARMSYKFSSFISRGIIHVICFLLLLSYTSVATTSLLLLRSLTFDNVDKVYTYLSPDIEYFYGRHLPYFLTAILCTLVIVIGLPLLLLLEPFFNHKIDFTRIKPLLDQFQGCYRDRYRSFAAYYMTCRLVIILVIISYPSNSDTSQYLLIIINSSLAWIHMTIKPYKSKILDRFDGFVLQLMIVVSVVPLINSYDRSLLVVFMAILVILPLITFLILELYLYKNAFKKVATCCVLPKPDTTHVTNEVPMRDFIDSVIDDSRRVNATVCEM